jgi:hypothetical protein
VVLDALQRDLNLARAQAANKQHRGSEQSVESEQPAAH